MSAIQNTIQNIFTIDLLRDLLASEGSPQPTQKIKRITSSGEERITASGDERITASSDY